MMSKMSNFGPADQGTKLDMASTANCLCKMGKAIVTANIAVAAKEISSQNIHRNHPHCHTPCDMRALRPPLARQYREDRAAYEATLQQKLEGKMASAREKVAKSEFRSRGTPDSEELR